MTIHHDKMAYGRLASSREELSEERLAQMLKALNEGEKQTVSEKNEQKDGEEKKGK